MSCLSVRQPWASLLVSGTKTIEWRTWPTPHRGVLWIHAAAYRPTADEIHVAEETFRLLASARTTALTLPTSYPTACIIGRVSVVGCVPASEVGGSQFAGGQILEDGPRMYAWLCTEPTQIARTVPCKGAQGIWQIPRETLLTLQQQH